MRRGLRRYQGDRKDIKRRLSKILILILNLTRTPHTPFKSFVQYSKHFFNIFNFNIIIFKVITLIGHKEDQMKYVISKLGEI